jgi:hypothetical protein
VPVKNSRIPALLVAKPSEVPNHFVCEAFHCGKLEPSHSKARYWTADSAPVRIRVFLIYLGRTRSGVVPPFEFDPVGFQNGGLVLEH